jgi:hypothetical protein
MYAGLRKLGVVSTCSLLSKSKNSTSIPKILQDGTEITDPVAISNVFNKHFTEIGRRPKLAAQIPTTAWCDFL